MGCDQLSDPVDYLIDREAEEAAIRRLIVIRRKDGVVVAVRENLAFAPLLKEAKASGRLEGVDDRWDRRMLDVSVERASGFEPADCFRSSACFTTYRSPVGDSTPRTTERESRRSPKCRTTAQLRSTRNSCTVALVFVGQSASTAAHHGRRTPPESRQFRRTNCNKRGVPKGRISAATGGADAEVRSVIA